MELDLPILDRMYKEMENPSEKIQKLRAMIKDADGYVAVTPEYNHGTSSAMKNTLVYFLMIFFTLVISVPELEVFSMEQKFQNVKLLSLNVHLAYQNLFSHLY